MSYLILSGLDPLSRSETWEHAAKPRAERTLCSIAVGSLEPVSEHDGDSVSVAAELSCPYCRSAVLGVSDPERDEEDWRYEVANGDTRLGLTDWLAHKEEAHRA